VGPTSCPLCGAPAPSPPQPRSLRQARWGYWTCPVCGTEADKWGRAVGRGDPPKPTVTQAALRTKFIMILAGGYFCLTLLFQWTGRGVSQGGLPSTLGQAAFEVALDGAETALFIALYYFVMRYILQRLRPTERDADPAPPKTRDGN